MKLSSRPSADAREASSHRLRRERADAQALRIVYPALQSLRIDLTFEDARSNAPAPQAHELYPAARAFFSYPCPHFDCDGGFNLNDSVQHVVSGHAKATSGRITCGGLRPADPPGKRPCQLQLTYRIRADYTS